MIIVVCSGETIGGNTTGRKCALLAFQIAEKTMKIYLPLIIILLILTVACQKQVPIASNTQPASQTASTPVAESTIPKDGNYTSKGKVTKVNPDMPSIELNHEEIAGVMPAMQMEFYVKDKSLLEGIKVGDNVEFILEYKHPSETIVGIKKIQ